MGPRKRGKLKKKLEMPAFGGSLRRNFHITVFLTPSKEIFHTNKVSSDMRVIELKSLFELLVGIPSDVQRISYLDDGDLVDESDIKSNDIVPGSTITMTAWNMWLSLIKAVTMNDLMAVFELGVIFNTKYTTPNMEYMSEYGKKTCINHRAEVALMLAAHRGYKELVHRLIDGGTNLNGTTPEGRTALHLAAAMGHGSIVDLLLANGIDANIEDNMGQTALMIAEQFDQKACGRHLFLFRWQERAKQVKPQSDIPKKEHQYFDSAQKIGFKGHELQIYRMQIGGPNEFDSSALDAHKHDPLPKTSFRKRYRHQLRNGMDSSRISPCFISGEKISLPPLPMTHGEWVKHKNIHERQQLKLIQASQDKKMLLEEDRDAAVFSEDLLDEKLTEIENAESYENWLKKQQQQLKFESKSPGGSPAPSQIEKGKGYLREYLESLLEQKSMGFVSDNWLVVKGINMLDSVEERPPLKPLLWSVSGETSP